MLEHGRRSVSFGKGMREVKARYGPEAAERWVVVGR
jgi:hypothetical protein